MGVTGSEEVSHLNEKAKVTTVSAAATAPPGPPQ